MPSHITVRWDMGTNDAKPGYYSSKFVIKNVSGKPLDSNWMFFFNQFSRQLELSPTCPLDIKEVSTTYYQVKPNERYATLDAGDSIVVDMMMKKIRESLVCPKWWPYLCSMATLTSHPCGHRKK